MSNYYKSIWQEKQKIIDKLQRRLDVLRRRARNEAILNEYLKEHPEASELTREWLRNFLSRM